MASKTISLVRHNASAMVQQVDREHTECENVRSYFTTLKLLHRKSMGKMVSHEQQLYVHTLSRKLFTELTSTLCLFNKVRNCQRSWGSLQELQLNWSPEWDQRQGPPQVAIKMSPVCSPSYLTLPPAYCNWLYTLHGQRHTPSCETHSFIYLKECVAAAL